MRARYPAFDIRSVKEVGKLPHKSRTDEDRSEDLGESKKSRNVLSGKLHGAFSCQFLAIQLCAFPHCSAHGVSAAL